MFRVQSNLEYPTSFVEELDFEPTDYTIDLRRQYAVREILRVHGSPFEDSRPIPGESDPRQIFAQTIERFLIQAKLASTNAQSYRNFNVGTMFLAEREPGFFGVFHGANTKRFPDDQKVCAEEVALAKAVHRDFQKIIGIAIFGPTQEDHGSGLSLPVLHPCEACRARFTKSPLADNNMLIASANHDGQFELTTLGTVLALHEDKVDPDTINTHRVNPAAARAVIQMSILGGWIPESDIAS